MEILLAGTDEVELEKLQIRLQSLPEGVVIASSADSLKALCSNHTAAVVFTSTAFFHDIIQKKLINPRAIPCLLLLEPTQNLPSYLSDLPSVDIFPFPSYR